MTISLEKIGFFSKQRQKSRIKDLRIFVPVDFSDSSYNALEYAMNMAKNCCGSIDLFHITDLSELPESDNPVVMHRLMNQLTSKATSRLSALREILSENKVNVTLCESVVGNTIRLLEKKLYETNPDIVVLPSKTFGGITTASLFRHVRYPVLFLPTNASFEKSSSTLLFCDSKSLKPKKLTSIFDIVHHTTKTLLILTPGSVSRKKKMSIHEFITGNEYHVSVEYQESIQINNRNILSVSHQNKVSLLCHFYTPSPLWKRFFLPDTTLNFISKITVPTLLFH